MQIIYSNNKPLLSPANNSVFLAGPTPRLKETPSWRPEAVKLFEKYGFDGTICYPEYEPGLDISQCDYNNQIEWEHNCLENCSIIMFWVPRDIKGNMPAFTTNIEFGYWMAKAPQKVMYGRPELADNMRYFDYIWYKYSGKNYIMANLDGTVAMVTKLLKLGEQSEEKAS